MVIAAAAVVPARTDTQRHYTTNITTTTITPTHTRKRARAHTHTHTYTFTHAYTGVLYDDATEWVRHVVGKIRLIN